MIILLHNDKGEGFAINTDSIETVSRNFYNGRLCNILKWKPSGYNTKIKETPEQVVEIAQKSEAK